MSLGVMVIMTGAEVMSCKETTTTSESASDNTSNHGNRDNRLLKKLSPNLFLNGVQTRTVTMATKVGVLTLRNCVLYVVAMTTKLQ